MADIIPSNALQDLPEEIVVSGTRGGGLGSFNPSDFRMQGVGGGNNRGVPIGGLYGLAGPNSYNTLNRLATQNDPEFRVEGVKDGQAAFTNLENASAAIDTPGEFLKEVYAAAGGLETAYQERSTAWAAEAAAKDKLSRAEQSGTGAEIASARSVVVSAQNDVETRNQQFSNAQARATSSYAAAEANVPKDFARDYAAQTNQAPLPYTRTFVDKAIDAGLEGIGGLLGTATRGAYNVGSNLPVVGGYIGDAIEGSAEWLRTTPGVVGVGPKGAQGQWGAMPPWMPTSQVNVLGQIPGSSTNVGTMTGTIFDTINALRKGQMTLKEAIEKDGGAALAKSLGISEAVLLAAAATGKTLMDLATESGTTSVVGNSEADAAAAAAALADTTASDVVEGEGGTVWGGLQGGNLATDIIEGTVAEKAAKKLLADQQAALGKATKVFDDAGGGAVGTAAVLQALEDNGLTVQDLATQTGISPDELNTFIGANTTAGDDAVVTGTDLVPAPVVVGTDEVADLVPAPVVTGTDLVPTPVVTGTDLVPAPVVTGTDLVPAPVVTGTDEVPPIVTGIDEVPPLTEVPGLSEVPRLSASPPAVGTVVEEPGELVDIQYLYDVFGDSIFAPELEEKELALKEGGLVDNYNSMDAIMELLRGSDNNLAEGGVVGAESPLLGTTLAAGAEAPRRAGEYGRRYFTDPTYTATGLDVAGNALATEADAVNIPGYTFDRQMRTDFNTPYVPSATTTTTTTTGVDNGTDIFDALGETDFSGLTDTTATDTIADTTGASWQPHATDTITDTAATAAATLQGNIYAQRIMTEPGEYNIGVTEDSNYFRPAITFGLFDQGLTPEQLIQEGEYFEYIHPGSAGESGLRQAYEYWQQTQTDADTTATAADTTNTTDTVTDTTPTAYDTFINSYMGRGNLTAADAVSLAGSGYPVADIAASFGLTTEVLQGFLDTSATNAATAATTAAAAEAAAQYTGAVDNYDPDVTADVDDMNTVISAIKGGTKGTADVAADFGVRESEVWGGLLRTEAFTPEELVTYLQQANPEYTETDLVLRLLEDGQASAEELAAYYSDSKINPITGEPYTVEEIKANFTTAGGTRTLAQGGYLGGTTDGMADQVPATIDNKEPARLSHGEFVIPADAVAHFGNGNSEAGADFLTDMLSSIREDRTGNPKQGRQIDPNQYLA